MNDDCDWPWSAARTDGSLWKREPRFSPARIASWNDERDVIRPSDGGTRYAVFSSRFFFRFPFSGAFIWRNPNGNSQDTRTFGFDKRIDLSGSCAPKQRRFGEFSISILLVFKSTTSMSLDSSSSSSSHDSGSMVADGQQRREEQTLCAYTLAELQNEEIKGLFGVKLLAKVYPQKFLMLRETHTRVMEQRAKAAPEIALPPSNWGADFEEVASMLEDAETKEQVLQAYKTCFSTLMRKLEEYDVKLRAAAKESASCPAQANNRPDQDRRGADRTESESVKSGGSGGSKRSSSSISSDQQRKEGSGSSSEKRARPAPNSVSTTIMKHGSPSQIANFNNAQHDMKPNKASSDDKGPKIIAAYLLSQKVGHEMAKSSITAIARLAFPHPLSKLTDEEVFERLADDNCKHPSGAEASLEEDEMWSELCHLAKVSKCQSNDTDTMQFFHHFAEFGNGAWPTVHNILYNRTLKTLGFDPADKDFAREVKLASGPNNNKGKSNRTGNSGYARSSRGRGSGRGGGRGGRGGGNHWQGSSSYGWQRQYQSQGGWHSGSRPGGGYDRYRDSGRRPGDGDSAKKG